MGEADAEGEDLIEGLVHAEAPPPAAASVRPATPEPPKEDVLGDLLNEKSAAPRPVVKSTEPSKSVDSSVIEGLLGDGEDQPRKGGHGA